VEEDHVPDDHDVSVIVIPIRRGAATPTGRR